MTDAAVELINKKEIGARIKKLRKDSGLRQWQLAEMIGATQPAIHMYERGVLPEPKRLLELARIGDTTVEWILTGRHWENGSEEMRRVPREIYRLAFQLKEYGEEEREAIESALEVVASALKARREAAAGAVEGQAAEDLARALQALPESALAGLRTALGVLSSVSETLMSQAVGRLRSAGGSRMTGDEADDAHGADGADAAYEAGAGGAGKKRAFKTRAAGIEAVRGHIYRIDGSLLVLNDILRDKDLRAELEETLGKLSSKLDSKKSRIVKMRKSQRSK